MLNIQVFFFFFFYHIQLKKKIIILNNTHKYFANLSIFITWLCIVGLLFYLRFYFLRFIHVVKCIDISFIFIALHENMPQFIHSIIRHFGCIQSFAITNTTTMNIPKYGSWVPLQQRFSNFTADQNFTLRVYYNTVLRVSE